MGVGTAPTVPNGPMGPGVAGTVESGPQQEARALQKQGPITWLAPSLFLLLRKKPCHFKTPSLFHGKHSTFMKALTDNPNNKQLRIKAMKVMITICLLYQALCEVKVPNLSYIVGMHQGKPWNFSVLRSVALISDKS